MNFKEQYNQIFGEPTKGSLDELQYKKLELFVKIEEQKRTYEIMNKIVCAKGEFMKDNVYISKSEALEIIKSK